MGPFWKVVTGSTLQPRLFWNIGAHDNFIESPSPKSMKTQCLAQGESQTNTWDKMTCHYQLNPSETLARSIWKNIVKLDHLPMQG